MVLCRILRIRFREENIRYNQASVEDDSSIFLKFNNFSTTLDYLRQDGEKNSYLLNKTSYNFNETNNLTFSTRENLKTNLTEFYNLIYQYKNDCLAASVEYQKDYYKDREIKPKKVYFLNFRLYRLEQHLHQI